MNKYAIIDSNTNEVINIIIYDGVSDLLLEQKYKVILANNEHYEKYNQYILLKFPIIANNDAIQQR